MYLALSVLETLKQLFPTERNTHIHCMEESRTLYQQPPWHSPRDLWDTVALQQLPDHTESQLVWH